MRELLLLGDRGDVRDAGSGMRLHDDVLLRRVPVEQRDLQLWERRVLLQVCEGGLRLLLRGVDELSWRYVPAEGVHD